MRCTSSAPGSAGETLSFGSHTSGKQWPKWAESGEEEGDDDDVGSGWTRGSWSRIIVPPEKHTQTATLGTTSGHSAPRSPHQTCLRSAGYLSLDTGAYFFSGQGEASGAYTRAAGLKQGSRADLQTVPK